MHPFRFGVQVEGPKSATELRTLCQRAENLGYTTISVTDHLTAGHRGPFSLMAALASASERLRIGSLVLCNELRPAEVVIAEVRGLIELFGNRIELGIGAGWLQDDFDRLGVRMRPAGERVAALAQVLPQLRAALPEVCLLVAGGGRRVLTLAAQHADVVGLNGQLTEGGVTSRTLLSLTAAASAERAAWIGQASAHEHRPEINELLFLVAVDERWERRLATERLSLRRDTPLTLVGSRERCIEELERRRRELGINYFTVREAGMERLAPVVAAMAS